ncbi:MAG: KH domain-containing protein [Oscillospiraceae bacterium]|nr:KH domain-containing protein [Oscillospiraceae bacterium]
MKDLLEYIAKNLVDKPDEVSIDEVERDGVVTLTLRVASEDMGKVIGRQGRIVREIRTILKTVGQRYGKKVMVVIAE